MARKRGRRRKREQGLDLEAVLAERVLPSLQELLGLISAVNPTDRGLSKGEIARRYAGKARLQSLLIARFAADLEVVSDPMDADLVLLRHRQTGRSAGHAVVTELDEDARRWVRARLDQQELDAASRDALEHPTLPADDDAAALLDDDTMVAEGGDARRTADALVASGQRALAAYDYQLAESHLWLAVQRSADSIRAAEALLELLVDHLAADAAALEAVELFSPELLESVSIRLLLGVASARQSDHAGALSYVRGLDDPRAADVYFEVAQRALRAGEGDVVADCLAEARQIAASDARLCSLEAQLDDLRARERQPAELRLAELLRGEDLDQAEEQAKTILRRFGESDASQRALARIAKRRKRLRIEELQGRAEDALRREDLDLAVTLYKQAIALGARRLETQLASAESLRRARAGQAKVAEVCGALDGSELRAATVHDARGALAAGYQLEEQGAMAAFHPAGGAGVGGAGDQADGLEDEVATISWVGVDGSRGQQQFPGAESVTRMATALADGVCYLQLRSGDASELVALEPGAAGGLDIRYRVSVPSNTLLVTNAAGQRVAALSSDGRGVEAIALGASAPQLGGAPHLVDRLPSFSGALLCRAPLGDDARMAELAGQVRSLSAPALKQYVARYRDRHAAEPGPLLDLC